LFLLDGLMPNYGLRGVKAIMESQRRGMVVDPAHIPPPGILASWVESHEAWKLKKARRLAQHSRIEREYPGCFRGRSSRVFEHACAVEQHIFRPARPHAAGDQDVRGGRSRENLEDGACHAAIGQNPGEFLPPG
jgi:hypothetical protein